MTEVVAPYCLDDGTPAFHPLGSLPYDPDDDRVQWRRAGVQKRARIIAAITAAIAAERDS